MEKWGPYIGIAAAVAVGVALAPLAGWLLAIAVTLALIGLVVLAVRRAGLAYIGAMFALAAIAFLLPKTSERTIAALPLILIVGIVALAVAQIIAARRTPSSKLIRRNSSLRRQR